jgi:hypothetical protein
MNSYESKEFNMRQCAECGSASGARGSVCQWVRQCACIAVRTASACGSVTVLGSVWQRTAVCGCLTVRQCEAMCSSVQ